MPTFSAASVACYIGDETWPPGCCLKFVEGEQFTHQDRVAVKPLEPKEITDVGLDIGQSKQHWDVYGPVAHVHSCWLRVRWYVFPLMI